MFSDKKSDSSSAKKTSRSRTKSAATTSAASQRERSQSATTSVSAATVSDEQIRTRAYQLFVERGGQGGTAEQDWLRAEAEVRGAALT